MSVLLPLSAGIAFVSVAHAQPRDAGGGGDAASSAASASSTASESLPSGHPKVEQRAHGEGGIPGMFEPPEDTEREETGAAEGTILVDILDSDNKPIAGQEVDLGVVVQSIAKGESRKHFSSTSDASGRATFTALDSGSGFAYRVTAPKDGATFAAMPFQLPQGKAMHVALHVYAVTHDVDAPHIVDPKTGEQRPAIFIQNLIFAEVRDDRIQFEQVLTVFNLGKEAWVPDDLLWPLPDGFTALTSQQQMNDQGIVADKTGARLHGTFGPGRHAIDYRWQLPWSGESEVDADIGMPPHIFQAIVMTPYAPTLKLVVDGFPAATPRTDNQGQRLLVTQTEAGDRALTHVHVALHDLPTPGPARYLASSVAGLTVVAGLAFAASSASTRSRKRGASRNVKSERQQLLAELEDLERAYKDGDVGPQTYQRARQELIDAIARTLAVETRESSA